MSILPSNTKLVIVLNIVIIISITIFVLNAFNIHKNNIIKEIYTINKKDGANIIYIPKGEFVMGGGTIRYELPQHSVYLKGYWIYQNEVSVAEYRRYSKDVGKIMPTPPPWGWIDNHPMINVSWRDAQAYCQWAGGRLPTEAEWEKAARGTDGRTFPWGNHWNSNNCANSMLKPNKRTFPIGTFVKDKSPFGINDMAGNVSEWCQDWYSEDYYSNSPYDNPQGPREGINKILRGGAWSGSASGIFGPDPYMFTCFHRINFAFPYNKGLAIGFRCVIPEDKHDD